MAFWQKLTKLLGRPGDLTMTAPGPAGYLAGVSWPRSGHHLLIRMLGQYLGDEFSYCEFYRSESCCKKTPCSRAGQINFSKSHDGGFDYPQLENVRYLIQVREFLPALVSNFELHVTGGGGEDTPEGFRLFASRQWTRYRKFKKKWITSDFGRRHLIIDYEWLTSDPVDAVATTLKWMYPDIKPDRGRLREIAISIEGISKDRSGVVKTGTGVRKTRRIEDFRYYDPDLFDMLGRLVLGRGEVVNSYSRIYGHPPEEAEILPLQCLDSLDDLRRTLRDRIRGGEDA